MQEIAMANTTFKRCAAATGLAAVLSLGAATPGNAAHWGGGHWGPGAAVGAGNAGFALGAAAAATAAPYYGYGGYYDYDPGPVVVVPGPVYPGPVYPGPVYYGYDGVAPYYDGGLGWYPWRRRGQCRFDIRGC
jgi:hypothetical protein